MSDKLKIPHVSNVHPDISEQNYFGSAVGYPDLLSSKAELAIYPLNAEQPVLTCWDAKVDEMFLEIEDFRDYEQHAGAFLA